MEFIDLKAQYAKLKEEINENIQQVLDSGQYMMGDHIKELEKQLADYVGVKHCISCANGTDALSLALMAFDIKKGDAVFVPSFTFYATAEVVSLAGATPIFVDVYQETFNMDVENLEYMIEKVSSETDLTPKAIIPVDLFGQPADYGKLNKVAEKYDLIVIEDGAQGFGGAIDGKIACSFGKVSTTSFFPAKPLGCYGDGGAIFTNDDDIKDVLESLRVHGKGSFKYDNVRVGMNSRLDTIQAGILLPKLNAFKLYELDKRNEAAKCYNDQLIDIVEIPKVKDGIISSWAQYTILLNDEKERSYVQKELKEKGIPTMVYYPTPLHKQTVYKDYNFHVEKLVVSEEISKKCLSLPMHAYLSKTDQERIIIEVKKTINCFRGN